MATSGFIITPKLGVCEAGSSSESEELFESFCRQHELDWQRLSEGAAKTPDYSIKFGEASVAVEVEQIETMQGFNLVGVSSRTVGWHVRNKINEARAQVQVAARAGVPTVLLIYNAVDPLQLFGTEEHDFLSAMYGELTTRIDRATLESSSPFHGRNARLRDGYNTSFSGVGHLQRTSTGASVTVYKNAFAVHPLPCGSVPSCFRVVSVEAEHAA